MDYFRVALTHIMAGLSAIAIYSTWFSDGANIRDRAMGIALNA